MGDGSDLRHGHAGPRFGNGRRHQVRHLQIAGKRQFSGDARGGHLLGHHAELMLHGLEFSDGLAELHPVVAVLQRHGENLLHGPGDGGGVNGGVKHSYFFAVMADCAAE
ncbi:hypothetical protein D3C78_1223230 [compost metagenome]